MPVGSFTASELESSVSSTATSSGSSNTMKPLASSASRASSEWWALRLSTTTMAFGGSWLGEHLLGHVQTEHVAVHAAFERAGRHDPQQTERHHQRDGRAAVERHSRVSALRRERDHENGGASAHKDRGTHRVVGLPGRATQARGAGPGLAVGGCAGRGASEGQVVVGGFGARR